MNNRIDAIYARQSVDKKDSISIESQIEFCKYELKGGNCKEYTDKGYSGKNTDRPKFQELVRDIKRGLIAKVVVYKLDRISRSILDFANMMELFQQYNVEFVSSTEKFDTSTPMGRAMLNICIVFAQLERETIQKRVTDAYYSRCKRGFYMGGRIPYGFAKTEHYGFRYTQYIGKARIEMKAGLTFACMNLKKLAKILVMRNRKLLSFIYKIEFLLNKINAREKWCLA